MGRVKSKVLDGLGTLQRKATSQAPAQSSPCERLPVLRHIPAHLQPRTDEKALVHVHRMDNDVEPRRQSLRRRSYRELNLPRTAGDDLHWLMGADGDHAVK